MIEDNRHPFGPLNHHRYCNPHRTSALLRPRRLCFRWSWESNPLFTVMKIMARSVGAAPTRTGFGDRSARLVPSVFSTPFYADGQSRVHRLARPACCRPTDKPRCRNWWKRRDSHPEHRRCHRRALLIELRPRKSRAEFASRLQPRCLIVRDVRPPSVHETECSPDTDVWWNRRESHPHLPRARRAL